jgi:hypothetical protein
MIPFTVFLAKFPALSVQLDFLEPEDPLLLSFLLGSGEHDADLPFALLPPALTSGESDVSVLLRTGVASDERRRGDCCS